MAELLNKKTWKNYRENDAGAYPEEHWYIQTTSDIIDHINGLMKGKTDEEFRKNMESFCKERKIFIQYALKNSG